MERRQLCWNIPRLTLFHKRLRRRIFRRLLEITVTIPLQGGSAPALAFDREEICGNPVEILLVRTRCRRFKP